MLRRARTTLIMLSALVGLATARADEITIFAAASLTDALQDVARLWQDGGHGRLTVSVAASSVLARQLDQGARASIFISADERWMDWAQQHGLVVPETRRDLLGNSLVLVMAKDRVHPVSLSSDLDLRALLGAGGRLAVGDPASVPAGIYAQQALESLGLWAGAEPLLARAENVRSALLLVERGEAQAGIVYATDAAGSPNVAIAATFPATSHEPIVYPAAVVRSADTPEARAVLSFLDTPAARDRFKARGFITK